MCVGKTKIFWPETSRVEISGVSMDCIWPGWVTPHSHLVASPQSGDISPANSSQYPQHSQLYSCTGFNSSYWLLDLHLSVKMSSRNTIKQFKIRDTSNRMFKTASKDFSSLNQQNHKTLPPLMWHSVNLAIVHVEQYRSCWAHQDLNLFSSQLIIRINNLIMESNRYQKILAPTWMLYCNQSAYL